MEIKTLKDFLKIRERGVDVCDSNIECPYCYMDYLTEEETKKDDYYRFLDYVESNVKLDFYNPKSFVGEIAGVKYLDFLNDNFELWVAFTNKVNNEEHKFKNYEDKEDFIENSLVYTLENMLNGNYSIDNYTLFMKLSEVK